MDERIIEYLKFFNNTKTTRKNNRYFINEETGISFSMSENDDEVVFSFYGSKESISFITNYFKFRSTFKPSKEYNNLNTYIFNEYCKANNKRDKIVEAYRNTKLINPFRNIRKIVTDSSVDISVKNALDFLFKNKDTVYVHSGFVELFNSICGFFYEKVTETLEKNKRLVILGNSFGSNIARLAFVSAIIAHPNNYNNIYGFIYSAPRLGNKNFETFLNKLNETEQHLFIVNLDKDALINTPPKELGFVDPFKVIKIDNSEELNMKYFNSHYYFEKMKNMI